MKYYELPKNFVIGVFPAMRLYLDIHYMVGYRIFTWNKDSFPDMSKV